MPDDDRLDFLKTQHALGNQRIGQAVQQLQRIEIYVFLGCAAVYAFAYSKLAETEAQRDVLPLILWLPVALILFAIVRVIMQLLYIGAASQHLRTIEGALSDYVGISRTNLNSLGWEYFYGAHTHMKWTHRSFRALLWGGLFVGSACIAYDQIGVPKPVPASVAPVTPPDA